MIYYLLSTIIYLIRELLLRIVGVTIGVGLGLGLAIHVRETLAEWQHNDDEIKRQRQCMIDNHGHDLAGGSGSTAASELSKSRSSLVSKNDVMVRSTAVKALSRGYTIMGGTAAAAATTTTGSGNNDQLQDSYRMLMLDAGYHVPRLLRGQIVKDDDSSNGDDSETAMHEWMRHATTGQRGGLNFYNNRHRPIRPNNSTDCTRGVDIMTELYPRLPKAVCAELGKLMDLIIRDYVSCWYTSMDDTVHFHDAAAAKAEAEAEAQAARTEIKTESNENNPSRQGKEGDASTRIKSKAQPPPSLLPENKQRRTMIFSTRDERTAPFMDIMYDTLSYLFGNLSMTAMERVNIIQFILVKVTEILAKTLKIYRIMRERARRRALIVGASSFNVVVSSTSSICNTAANMIEDKKLNQEQNAESRGDNIIPKQSSIFLNNANTVRSTSEGSSISSRSTQKVSNKTVVPLESPRKSYSSKQLKRSTTGGSISGDIAERNSPKKGEMSSNRSIDVGKDIAASTAVRRSGMATSTASEDGAYGLFPPSSPAVAAVSEIAVAREFLLAGRLHKVITFGIDVPSLVFGEADEISQVNEKKDSDEDAAAAADKHLNYDKTRDKDGKIQDALRETRDKETNDAKSNSASVTEVKSGETDCQPKSKSKTSRVRSSDAKTLQESETKGKTEQAKEANLDMEQDKPVKRTTSTTDDPNLKTKDYQQFCQQPDKIISAVREAQGEKTVTANTVLPPDWKCSICSINSTVPISSSHFSPDDVLGHRLFCSPILYQAELDYNRVISSQTLRKLIPSREAQSFIVRSFGVEMLAGCLLTPIMGMITPETVNGLIVSAQPGGVSEAATAGEGFDNSSNTLPIAEELMGSADFQKEFSEGRNSKGNDRAPKDKKLVEEVPAKSNAVRTGVIGPRSDMTVEIVNNAQFETTLPRSYDEGKKINSKTDNEIFKGPSKRISNVSERDDLSVDDDDDLRSTLSLSSESASSTGKNGNASSVSSSSETEGDALLGDANELPLDAMGRLDMEEPENEKSPLDTVVSGDGEGSDVDDNDSFTVRDGDHAIAQYRTHQSASFRSDHDEMNDVSFPEERNMQESAQQPDETDSLNKRDRLSDESRRILRAKAETEANRLLPFLTLTVLEVQNCAAYAKSEYDEVDWDRPEAREAVCNLVLVIEALLTAGKRKRALEAFTDRSETSPDVETSLEKDDYAPDLSTLAVMLMDMTTDLDRYEARSRVDADVGAHQGREYDDISNEIESSGEFLVDPLDDADIVGAESSTLRTIVAAWLHTGCIYRILGVLISSRSILRLHYFTFAILRQSHLAGQFVAQLRGLDGQEILVDTMAVLGADSNQLLSQNVDDITLSSISPSKGTTERMKGRVALSDPNLQGARVSQNLGSAAPRPRILRSFTTSIDRSTSSVRNSIDKTNLAVSAAAAAASDNVNELITKNKSATNTSFVGTNPVVSGNAPPLNSAKLITNVRASMSANRQRLSRWVKPATIDDNYETISTYEEGEHPRNGTVPKSSAMSPTAHLGGNVRRNVQGNRSPGGAMQVGEVTPCYLNYHRNETFAASLRDRRDQGYKSWQKVVIEMMSTPKRKQAVGYNAESEGTLTITPRKNSDSSRELLGTARQRELQNINSLAHLFYRSTVNVSLRKQSRETPGAAHKNNEDDEKVLKDVPNNKNLEEDSISILEDVLCTMEVASSRRKIEVPDEDSSFLLRAQPRTLTPLGVHRDQHDHGQSFKCYLATYEEPVTHQDTKRYHGARVLHHCLLRYYPIDKSATMEDVRDCDEPGNEKSATDAVLLAGLRSSLIRGGQFRLHDRLLKERNLCQKTRISGNVVSTVSAMEPSDFAGTPRAGRAVDFVYRMSLFERPIVEVAGRRFTINDSTAMRQHRADASAKELSDAALSIAILTGADFVVFSRSSPSLNSVTDDDKSGVAATPNSSENQLKFGSVLLRMKVKGTDSGGNTVEQMRFFRPSHIRAAMLITSARQEAQIQCLTYCVKAGSARQATRNRADALLQPALSLVELSASRQRDKEHVILRDLGIGITHIDRQQLQRNGIIDRRYPHIVRRLRVRVEELVQTSEPGRNRTLGCFRVRCAALVENLQCFDPDYEVGEQSRANVATPIIGGRFSREDWIVLRPFRDFIALHKHLKTQLGETVPRFAALTGQRRGRGVASIPSLSQATKGVALNGQRAIERKRQVLNEYFNEILAPQHLLGTSYEILHFFCADERMAFDESHHPGDVCKEPDVWGRIERRLVNLAPGQSKHGATGKSPARSAVSSSSSRASTSIKGPTRPKGQIRPANAAVEEGRGTREAMERAKSKSSQSRFIALRVSQITLSDVRNAIFDLLRQLFDLENATFWRSRMFAAIRTMSFMVTSAADFARLIAKVHLDYLTGEKVSEWVSYVRETIWPGGVYYTPSPELTVAEKRDAALTAKTVLCQLLPDQLKTILGQELSDEGLAMLHEMLQNRVVVKSLGYMILDTLWLELFPGLSDIATGTSALDFDD